MISHNFFFVRSFGANTFFPCFFLVTFFGVQNHSPTAPMPGKSLRDESNRALLSKSESSFGGEFFVSKTLDQVILYYVCIYLNI